MSGSSPEFRPLVWKTVVVHTVTYFVIGMAARLWRQYHTTGELVVTEKLANAGTARLLGFETVIGDDTMRYIMVGYVKKCIELSGGKNVNIEDTICSEKGCAGFQFKVNWD